MSVVEDVAKYLAANSTRLEMGVTLFGHNLPPSSENSNVSSSLPIVALIEELSLPPIGKFVPATGGLPAFQRNVLRVLCRSTMASASAAEPDPRPSRGLAEHVWTLMEMYPPNSTVAGGNNGPMTLETFGSPSAQTRDNNGRPIWSFTMQAMVLPTTST